jgi:hypothetical protein
VKRSPIRKVRPGLRRGEPSPEEKKATRIAARNRANGICEAQENPKCTGQRILPLEGDLWQRGHLAHGRAKARFGWRESEKNWLTWQCPFCHLISEHQKGIKMPRPDRPILVVEGFQNHPSL